MNDALKAKVAELEGVRVKARAITEAHPGEIPADKGVELKALLDTSVLLTTAIDELQSQDDARKHFDSVDDFLNKPQYRVPRGAGNGDDDARKSLLRTGWEVKNGWVCAPTSSGQLQQMLPEEALFGDLNDPDMAPAVVNYYKALRGTFEPDYRAAYVKHFRLAATKGPDFARDQMTGAELKALSEGTDTAGGFLVPPDAQAEVLQRLAQRAVMRQMARVVQTSRDLVRWPRVQPNSTSGSIYSSGFVGSWVGETPAFSATDPAFGLFEISIKKARTATKLSNDLIADAAFNVLSWLATNGAENLALVEDNGFLAGLGAALQPMGLLYSGATTVDVEGSTTDTISNTTSALGSASKLIDLEAALPPQYTPGARFLTHRLTLAKVRKLVDGQNRFLFVPGFGEPVDTLFGKPIVKTDFMPQDGTNANVVLIYGDFNNYIIAERMGITTTILRERFADTEETGIILTERVGGGAWNTDAFRFGIV